MPTSHVPEKGFVSTIYKEPPLFNNKKEKQGVQTDLSRCLCKENTKMASHTRETLNTH